MFSRKKNHTHQFIEKKRSSLPGVFYFYVHLMLCVKSLQCFPGPALGGGCGSLLTRLCGIPFLHSTWTKARRQDQWHDLGTNIILGLGL